MRASAVRQNHDKNTATNTTPSTDDTRPTCIASAPLLFPVALAPALAPLFVGLPVPDFSVPLPVALTDALAETLQNADAFRE
ncbi:hypothetical protein B0H19DRAFT_1255688 [Mycena capillaripes]|nr:hypothetical protein B0H19DRAFT_1255688 [Mycena capillaripes]